MIADLLAIVLAAQAVEITVTAHTKDGNNVTGVSRVAEFPFESSLGKITVRLKDVARLQFSGDVTVLSTQDGTSIRGKIHQDVWAISTKLGDFTLKTSDLVQLSVTGVRAGPPAPAPADAPPPTLKPAAPVGLAPVKTLKIGAAIPRTLRSADGKTLYLLDASDAKLHVVKLDTLERQKEIALSGGETCFSVSPGGGAIVAAGKRTISLVSLAQGKLLKTFSIEQEVTDVCALDDQTVVASGQAGIFLVSVAKQAVLQRAHQGSSGRLYMARDGKRVFTSGGSILLPDKSAGREELSFASNSRSSGEFSVSPDSRFAVSTQGVVYRLAKSFVADFAEVGKVEAHWTPAWAPSRRRLYLVTAAGFVKEVNTDTWELVKSWALGYRLADAFVDEDGGFLVGVGQPAPPGSHDREVRYSTLVLPNCDLLRFELPK